MVIAGANLYARHVREKGEEQGTRFVAQAVTWLNEERWTDNLAANGKELVEDEAPNATRASLCPGETGVG